MSKAQFRILLLKEGLSNSKLFLLGNELFLKIIEKIQYCYCIEFYYIFIVTPYILVSARSIKNI